jgi:hypothetical protein
MATTGIPLDSACLLAVALEGIVYGEHPHAFLRPVILTKLPRLLSPPLHRHNMVSDRQTAHTERQSPNRSSSHPAVRIEYCGWCNSLLPYVVTNVFQAHDREHHSC